MNTPTIPTGLVTETVPRAVAELGTIIEAIPEAVSSGVSSGAAAGRRAWRALPFTATPTSRRRWVVAGTLVVLSGALLVWRTRRSVHVDRTDGSDSESSTRNLTDATRAA